MAVKIPLYNQQTTAEGLTQANAHSELAADPTGSAMEKFGNAASHLGGIGMHILAEKENADAAAKATNILTDAHMSWADFQRKTYDAATDGAPDFTKNMMESYDKWAGETVNAIENEHGKKLLTTGIQNLRQSLFSTSMKMEAEAGVTFRANSIDESTNKYAAMVTNGQIPLDVARTNVMTAIANANFDPPTRVKLYEAATKTLGNAQLYRAINDNPEAVQHAINGATQNGFESAMNFTMKQEGGYTAKDSNGYEANFGVNKEFHPNVDVKNLTREGAKDIYRGYWDEINGDAIAAKDPKLATAVFDTAFNSGSDTAKDLLKKSGGDVGKFVDLREAYLNKLAKDNPEKYGKYQGAWKKRIGELRSMTSADAVDSQTKMAIDMVPADRLPSYANQAEAEINRQRVSYRSDLVTTESNHLTAFSNGESVATPLTEDQFIKAYGGDEGSRRFSAYRDNMQMSSTIAAAKTMTPAQQGEALAKNKPDPNSPTYASDVKRYSDLAQAIDKANTERKTNPIGYAYREKLGNVQPLDFSKPAEMAAQLSARTGIASQMESQYGTKFTLLTTNEAEGLRSFMNEASSQQKMQYIKSLSAGIQDKRAYLSVMQDIRPDSPITALAGIIANKSSPVISNSMFSSKTFQPVEVSMMILRGEELLNKSKDEKKTDGKGGFPMPSDGDFNKMISSEIGDAFANDPEGYQLAKQGIKAYYAADAANGRDFSGALDSDRLDNAILAVTGGFSNVNGNGKVIRPWGMDETAFNDKAFQAYKQAIAEHGMTGSHLDNYSAYGLQAVDDGKYLVTLGNSALHDPKGNAVVIDMNKPFGLRPDGTSKGTGYLGVLNLPNGDVATEYSMQSDAVKVNGQRIDFPTLIPTLTKDEVSLMVNDIIPNGKPVPDDVAQKAVDFALKRISEGKNVFIQGNERPSTPVIKPEKSKSMSNNRMSDK